MQHHKLINNLMFLDSILLPYKTDQLGNELRSCRLPIPIPAWNTLATLYEAYLQQT
jgi:hypothetical protein